MTQDQITKGNELSSSIIDNKEQLEMWEIANDFRYCELSIANKTGGMSDYKKVDLDFISRKEIFIVLKALAVCFLTEKIKKLEAEFKAL